MRDFCIARRPCACFSGEPVLLAAESCKEFATPQADPPRSSRTSIAARPCGR